jgi:hypothetical protein
MRRSVEVGPADRPNGGVGDRVLGQQQRAHAALLHGQVLLVIRSVPPPRASHRSDKCVLPCRTPPAIRPVAARDTRGRLGDL